MARPVFLVENLFSTIQFTAHVVSASAEAVSAESWRVATGRRSAFDRWMPSADNTEAWLQVDCAHARAATMIALDRGHNLAGEAVVLEGAASGAGPWTSVVTATIPSAATPASDIDAADGVLTEEGAWLKRFPSSSWRFWRLRIPAMGALLRPEVVGLWLGRAWTPLQWLDLPWGDENLELRAEETESDAGWVGWSQLRRVRAGEIGLKLHTEAEYVDEARYHIQGHFWRRRPMWIIYDAEQAERAVLAVPRMGSHGFDVQQGWSNRQARILWVEHEPRPA